jgi:hypothetical protein
MKSNINAWDMSLEQFISRFKAIRNQKLTQKTSQFSNLKCIGYDYRIYVNPETLEVINPFTKKDKGKKYKSFFSSVSADHVKELAFNYITDIVNGY